MTLALAAAQRARGDLSGAVATIEALGAPGWIVSPGQRMLAACYSDSGQLEKAEAILERHLRRRLPRFQSARQAYATRIDTVRDQLIARAKSGGLPKDIERRLETGTEEQKNAVFHEWLSTELDKDAELGRLRAEYERDQGAVPASISLGTVKLRRANSAHGDERQNLLDEGERSFLAIREEAEGTPSFHLGLGQVYHRLGKAEEGDRELSGLLKQSDLRLHLAVSEAYRELGLVKRAREAAQGVFDKGDKDLKQSAAMYLANLTSSLEERERWLTKTGSEAIPVKLALANTRGQLLLRDGKLIQADRELAVAAEGYSRDAAHNSSAANNAAVAYNGRFAATGDPSHLEKAAQMFEASLRLEPDNSLILSNLVGLLEDRAVFAVVEKRTHVRGLPLSDVRLDSLVAILLDGTDRERVAQELRSNSHFRRALELMRQEQVLAPRRPEAYQRELSWSMRLTDAMALQSLGERLSHVSEIDSTHQEDWKKEWESGARDEEIRKGRERALQALAKLREQEAKHGPTLGAVSAFEAQSLGELARLNGDIAQAQQTVAAWRRAQAAWPQLAPHEELADALFELAVLQAARESPELAQAWKEGFRSLETELIAWKAASENAPLKQALKRQSALQEAARLLHSLRPDQLGLQAWVIAWFAEDSSMQTAAASQMKDGLAAKREELSKRLEPESPQKTARAKLWKEICSR
ncbi:MAG: hypothetical protein HY901_16355 [Deltaproteobacteria bacterium]|nr:hypothetical protein [Deltaproteobacteria bacterium]